MHAADGQDVLLRASDICARRSFYCSCSLLSAAVIPCIKTDLNEQNRGISVALQAAQDCMTLLMMITHDEKHIFLGLKGHDEKHVMLPLAFK